MRLENIAFRTSLRIHGHEIILYIFMSLVEIRFNFQHAVGIEVTYLEVSLTTEDFTFVRLSIQDMTYSKIFQAGNNEEHHNLHFSLNVFGAFKSRRMKLM
jgi:hypothetical protein